MQKNPRVRMSFKKKLLASHPPPYSLFFHHGSCKKWWHLEQSLRLMWWDRVSRPILCCSPLDYDVRATWTLIKSLYFFFLSFFFFAYLFTAALSVTAPNWKQPTYPSTGKGTSSPRYTYGKPCSNKNGWTTWMNAKITTLSRTNRTKKRTYATTHCIFLLL